MASSAVDTTKYGEPIIRKASIYQTGFGNYDDSFNIETDAGMYYGEAGGTIAEKIGEGVTAIEVWMFDKDEFANTPSAIIASEHAISDQALQSRLAPRGELFKAEPGTKIVLETAALYVEARVVNVEYEDTAEIPNSVFKKVTIEVIAWAKGTSGGAGAATPVPPMPQPVMSIPPSPAPSAPTPNYAPPPMPAAPPPPPAVGGAKPPDDPFGGTGDFTPIDPNG